MRLDFARTSQPYSADAVDTDESPSEVPHEP